MPVLDHEIHQSVRHGADHRYGCWNRTGFADGYLAPAGYAEEIDYTLDWCEARIRLEYVPHRMSTECRYDMSLKDASCAGCQHQGKGEAYDRSIREA